MDDKTRDRDEAPGSAPGDAPERRRDDRPKPEEPEERRRKPGQPHLPPSTMGDWAAI